MTPKFTIEQSVIDGIIRDVCIQRGMTRPELTGQSRLTEHIDARREAVRRLMAVGLSTTQIGRALNRDHSTIVTAYRRGILQRMATSPGG